MKSNHFSDTTNLVIEVRPCKHDNKQKTIHKTEKLLDIIRTSIYVLFGVVFVAFFYLFYSLLMFTLSLDISIILGLFCFISFNIVGAIIGVLFYLIFKSEDWAGLIMLLSVIAMLLKASFMIDAAESRRGDLIRIEHEKELRSKYDEARKKRQDIFFNGRKYEQLILS